jgi:hypothetical protein
MGDTPKLYRWKCVMSDEQVRNPEGLPLDTWKQTASHCDMTVSKQVISARIKRRFQRN